MDSSWTEDLLQQYLTELQTLQEERQTRRKQQHQNGTNENDACPTNSSIPAEISRVAVQLLPFWVERPLVWFAKAEAQFTLAGINSEQTKSCYMISQLDHHYASVEDIITSPLKQNPYTTRRTNW
jgi:hypothetical protein